MRFGIVFLIAALSVSACESRTESSQDEFVELPPTLGLSLDEAKRVLKRVSHGFEVVADDGKSGRMVIVDDNWRVVGQIPRPGTLVRSDAEICLTVLKIEEFGKGIAIGGFACNPNWVPPTIDPTLELPDEVRRAVINSCSWPASDLARDYGIPGASKQEIADAVAADFQVQYQTIVREVCANYMK